MAVDAVNSSSMQEVSAKGDCIRAVARWVSNQPFENSDPSVWAVLTAISEKACQRPQGMHILLRADEHFLGRDVVDACFRFTGPSIGSHHCKIFRERATTDGDATDSSKTPLLVFLKDMSTNATFLNWMKLREDSVQAKLQHGDIISLVSAPHDDDAYAFVYREVNASTGLTNGVALKRKSDDLGAECKRLKGVDIGALDGPEILDQPSYMELRQQLQSLRSENHTIIA